MVGFGGGFEDLGGFFGGFFFVAELAFVGADGTDKAHSAAYIQAQVDGTPGGNDLPGRLIFSTNLFNLIGLFSNKS